MDITKKVALDLLNRSLNDIRAEVDASFAEADWDRVFAFLKDHAVISFVWPVVRDTPFYSRTVPGRIQARMKSFVLSSAIHNEHLMNAQDEVIRLLRENGIHCAVLKGASVAATYPQPELRALGDIDLLLDPGALEMACALLAREGYVRNEGDHGFHVSLDRQGVSVELHFAISEILDARQSRQIEALMSGALEDVSWRSMEAYIFPVLSPTRQALSLLLHMERHWLDTGIGLRQLLDWRAFILSHDESTLAEMMPALEKAGLLGHAKVFTTACILHLGLDAKRAACLAQTSGQLADDMMTDILESGCFGMRLKERTTSRLLYSADRKGKRESLLGGVLHSVNQSIQNHYPACRKHPVLLPFFWLYLPLRYWVRSLLGKRAKQSAREVFRIGIARKKLYQGLKQH